MTALVHSKHGVTLVGGGEAALTDLTAALALAPDLVAADGGANWLHDMAHTPRAIIGDIDSLRDGLRQTWADRIHRIAEQDSTDLDKCLRGIHAPYILALGFNGARLDHTLAAMASLLRHGSARVLLISARDVCFLAPPRVMLPTRPGDRVSLFPMVQGLTGRSDGLHWPIAGITFAPDGVVGTSNRAIATQVTLEFDRPGMLVLMARTALQAALRAVTTAPDWPRPD